MDTKPLVSIIVPIYNSEKYIDECVQSLLNQNYENIEIILVDDGSPDLCPVLCDEWEKHDNRIKVIHKKNGGVSDARNVGIRASSGSWLLFIDSDDVIPHCFVKELVNETCGKETLVVSKMERFHITVKESVSLNKSSQECGKDLIPLRGGMYCWGVLYSREMISSINLQFDPSLRNLEDVVWNGIYLRYITDIICVDVPYFYRINPNSITSHCGDFKWQVESWIAARRSIMNWFSDKPLTKKQRKEVSRMYRHCQNNIYAECEIGGVPYGTLKEIENQDSAHFNRRFIPTLEKIVFRCFPRLYYRLYVFILRIKRMM